ncbi:MAG: hypothetical protein WCO56_02940 [Verrucomicrobiota bacterium]
MLEKFITFCRYCNAAVLLFVALFFFILPGATVIHDLQDFNLRSASIPKAAWRMHRDLTPKYEQWARERLDSTRATELTTSNISGTEWPLFGSVFYLWATESLQDAWEKNHALTPIEPKVSAKEAIAITTRLVIDPRQANWVKKHWGENYLKTQNAFYRMLVISALTSHARLTGEKQYLPLLKDQVESLSAEIDASPNGLLEDYPGECYPGDVLTAIAMIRKADQVLGTDHSTFVHRAIRGFQNQALDPRGLVPYAAQAIKGCPIGPSRGCGNSYVSLFSPQIWPEASVRWYDLYSKYFWQETWTAAGFREYPNDMPGGDWYFDVDAGPVLKGYGFAACAFGVGAARVNGHFEHAYPLTTELLATSWPLPNGTLLVPRLLSNATDAPYLGEAAILYVLTRLPGENIVIRTGGSTPNFTLIILMLEWCIGLGLVVAAIWLLRRWSKRGGASTVPLPRLQLGAWTGLSLIALIVLFTGEPLLASLLLLIAQMLPRNSRLLTTDRCNP